MLTLTALVASAVALRLVWLFVLAPHQITWEGTEYARAAENLFRGIGYIGIRGTTLYLFPPLYSLLIAPVIFLVGNGEAAGVTISLIAGSLLVVPLYLAAEIVYGPRTALLTGVLAVSLPFAVDISTIVLSDALYLTLIAWGLLFALRTIRNRRPVNGIACGLALGLAYCTRPEAIVVAVAVLAAVAAALMVQPVRHRRATISVIVIGAAFVITSLPYVAFLSLHAHHLQIEAKSTVNVRLAERMRAGMSYDQAANEIDSSGKDVGPELSPTYDFANAQDRLPGLSTIIALAAANTARHLLDIPNVLRTRLFGSPPLLLFTLLGLVMGRWNRERAGYEFVLWAYTLAVLASLASVYHFYPRYADEFIPLLAIWGGHGVEQLRITVNGWLRLWWPQLLIRADLAAAALALLMVLLLFSARSSFRDTINSSQTLTQRQVGEWMRTAGIPSRSRIFSVSSQSVYYAGGTWVVPPWSPYPSAVFAYMSRYDPSYVILDAEQDGGFPYMATWLARGIPDSRARLLHVFEGPGGPVAVYRWRSARK